MDIFVFIFIYIIPAKLHMTNDILIIIGLGNRTKAPGKRPPGQKASNKKPPIMK